MRTLIICVAILLSASPIHAKESASTKCLINTGKTFEVDASCIQSNIESSKVYQEMETAIHAAAETSANQYVISTVTFNPKSYEITVLAHRNKKQN